MPLEHLRLQELSDREVLLILSDVADADGYADVEDMGAQLGLDPKHAVRIVTSRLTWLKRWEAVEREPAELVPKVPGEPPRRRRWRMTPAGRALAMGELRRKQQAALAEAKASDLLGITQLLAERQRNGSPAERNLVRREWRYRTEYVNRNGR